MSGSEPAVGWATTPPTGIVRPLTAQEVALYKELHLDNAARRSAMKVARSVWSEGKTVRSYLSLQSLGGNAVNSSQERREQND